MYVFSYIDHGHGRPASCELKHESVDHGDMVELLAEAEELAVSGAERRGGLPAQELRLKQSGKHNPEIYVV